MFLNKNKTNNRTVNTYNRRTNYQFSCGTTSSANNSTLSYTKSGTQMSDVFSSLNNQLNNNIKTINRNSNGMFPKKRGCGCGGRK